MAGDLTPESKGALDQFIEKLNLPELIAGPAGKAISRLVAGVIEIPAAYLDSFAQSIKDKTAARGVVHQEVSNAAAKLAGGDVDIVARAAHNLLAKEYRKQKNKEEIARQTIELLVEETPQQEASGPTKPLPDVDSDWLNIFERYAEDASTDRMQGMWARVLAGEIRKPNSFSLATLRFLAEVDQPTANLFQKYAGHVFNTDFIPYPAKKGREFSDFLELENAGLLTGTGARLTKIFEAKPPMTALMFGNEPVVVMLDKDVTINIPCVMLSRVGRELMQLTERKPDMKRLNAIATQLPKDGVLRVFRMKVGKNPPEQEVLWERPPDTP